GGRGRRRRRGGGQRMGWRGPERPPAGTGDGPRGGSPDSAPVLPGKIRRPGPLGARPTGGDPPAVPPGTRNHPPPRALLPPTVATTPTSGRPGGRCRGGGR